MAKSWKQTNIGYREGRGFQGLRPPGFAACCSLALSDWMESRRQEAGARPGQRWEEGGLGTARKTLGGRTAGLGRGVGGVPGTPEIGSPDR